MLSLHVICRRVTAPGMGLSAVAIAIGILLACAGRARAGEAPASAPDAAPATRLVTEEKPSGGWGFGNGQEFPGAKGQLALDDGVEPGRRPALRLAGDFSGGGNYVQAGIDLPARPVDALSFWIKAPGAEMVTVRMVDSGGQCHQIKLKLKKTPGWQKIYLPVAEFFRRMGTTSSLPVVARYEKWGGANDGRWHNPGKGLYILLGRGMFPDGKKGTLWLSDVRILSKPGTTTMVTRTVRLDDLLAEGEVDWGFTRGEEFPGAKGTLDVVKDQPREGMYALRMRGDFSGGGAYVAATKSFQGISATSFKAIRLQMRSATVQTYSMRAADATGQWHQKKRIPFRADGKWHEVAIVPKESAGVEHWGGANDGKWHPPAQALSIVIGKPSNPEVKELELLFGDVRAEVVLRARLKAAAYHEGFEKGAPLPDGWQARGQAAVAAGAFKGEKALRLERPAERRQQETAATGAAFPAVAGTWQLSGACKAELESPDNSYNGTLSLEALGAGGAVLERIPVRTQFGKANWQSFTRRVELPKGTMTARFAARLQKACGAFMVDELSAAQVAPTEGAEKRVDRILLTSDGVGNLLLPEDKAVVHATVEALKPLPKAERTVVYTLRDYWGAEQAPPGRATLERTERRGGRFIYTADLDLSAAPMEVGRYYEVDVAIPREAGEPYREHTGIARLPVAPAKQYKPEQIPFTIRNWDSRVKDYFFLADRIGIRMLGIWGGWKAKAPYAPHAPGIEWCKQLGARWVSGTPGHSIEQEGFKTYSEEALRKGMRGFLEKFAGQGLGMLCLGNEPHADAAKVKENVRGYKAIYEAAKAFDPKVFVIGTSVPPDERYFQAGYHKYLDAYDFHIYESPDNVRDSIRAYQRLMKKYGAEKPIFSTELGLNSQGMTRHAVATDMVKKLTVFFAAGGANVSWFTIQYPDPKGKARGTFGDSHCVFDCKYSLYNPRLDAITYYNMVNGICIKKFVEEKHYAGGVQAYLFRDAEGRCLQVLWTEEGRRDVQVPLAGVADVELVRIDGSRVGLEPAGGGVTLGVTGEPLLLLYRQAQGGLAEALPVPRMALAAQPLPVLKGGSSPFTLRGPGLEPKALRIVAPPRWTASLEAVGGDGVECTIAAPEETSAREGRVLVQMLGAAGAPTGEIAVRMAITSPLTVSVHPLPAWGGEPERVELRVRNNGREARQVQWTLALAEELPMASGTYALSEGKPPAAYLKGDSEGQLTLAGGEEKRIRTALADLDPVTIYRIQASVADPLGRAVECERLIGGFAAAPKAARPPTIDGTLDEADWARASVCRIADARQYFPLRRIEGAIQWTGAADLSGELRFLWDAKNLYIAATVADDVFRTGQNDSALWNQDGLQCLVDPQRESTVKTGKYDYSMGLGPKGPRAWCHTSGAASVKVGAAPDITVALRRADPKSGNVVYEVAIPWPCLAPFAPGPGANLGLALILNEDDGQGRNGFMGWFSGVHSKQLDMVGDVILLDR